MANLGRAAPSAVVGLAAIFILLVHSLGPHFTGFWTIVPCLLWLFICLLISFFSIQSDKVLTSIAPAFIAFTGFAAGFWPMASIISEEPIRSEMISLRIFLPNIFLIILSWVALYLLPQPIGDTAASRVYAKNSMASARQLLLATLFTMLFYVLTIDIMVEAAITNSKSTGNILQLFYGTNPIYFILLVLSFWGLIMAFTLAVKVFSEAETRTDGDHRFKAFMGDRRFLGNLIAVMPLIGFLGTILGIAEAIQGLEGTLSGTSYNNQDLQGLLRDSLGGLSLAFETTIIGIAASSLLLFVAAYIDREMQRKWPITE